MIAYTIMNDGYGNFRTIRLQYKKSFGRGLGFKLVKNKLFDEDEEIREFLSAKHKVPLDNIYIDGSGVYIAQSMADMRFLTMAEMDRSRKCSCDEVEPIDLKIKILDTDATVPKYMTDGSTCFDLFASEFKTVISHETVKVRTGISMEFPKGYDLQLRPRSGMSLKYPGYLPNSPCVIDSDYRGEIMIPIFNNTSDWLRIKKGDSLVQGVIVKVNPVKINVVSTLSDTDRGEGGFGSTGNVVEDEDETPDIKSCTDCTDVCRETCYAVDTKEDVIEVPEEPDTVCRTEDPIGSMEWKKCSLLWYMGLFDNDSIDFLAKKAAKQKSEQGKSQIHLTVMNSNGISEYVEKFQRFNIMMKKCMVDIQECKGDCAL